MPFPEAIKDEVRKRARFRCCRCHEVGIDVHHIIPQADRGPDTIDNAAPLCQNCHDRFGGNPKKRKEIRGMRDLWYEVAKEKWPTADDRSERLNDAVLRSDTATAGDLEQIANGLRAELDRLKAMLDSPTPAAIRDVASGIGTATHPQTPALIRASVAVRVNKAAFTTDPQRTPCYFVNILNTSPEQVTVTDIWFATNPAVHVLAKKMPVRIAPNDQWETWIAANQLPDDTEAPETLAAAALADGTVVSSEPGDDVAWTFTTRV